MSWINAESAPHHVTRCDCCGTACSGKVYRFREKHFPEQVACSRSCYEIAFASAIASPIFTAPRAKSLRNVFARCAP